MRTRCLIKCLYGIFSLFWTPISTKFWGLPYLYMFNMFWSLVVCFTHFFPWVLVHALIIHCTCTLDSPTTHTPYQVTCFTYYRCPGLKWLENHKAFVRPPAVVTLPSERGPLEAPLNNCVVWLWESRMELRVFSLSLGGGRLVYLWRYGRNLGQILGDYQR